MILETIFIWVGGITLICGVLLLLFIIFDKLLGTYLKNLDVFWRVFYLALLLSSKDTDNREKYLVNRIFEKNGKKYKIIELQKEMTK